MVKKLRFDERIKVRAIPHANRGKKCRGRPATKTKWIPQDGGGARQDAPQRESWADLTDQEDEARKEEDLKRMASECE